MTVTIPITNRTDQESWIRLTFSKLSLTTLIPQLVEQAINKGTSRMVRALKTQLCQ